MAAPNVSSTESLTKSPEMPEKGGSFQSCPASFVQVGDKDKLEIDLAVKCRGCFVEDPEMHYLFTVFDQKLSLADILMQTTSFMCKEDDGFPPYLCTKCTTCLIDFFNFKIQYQKTDIYVRTLIDKLTPDLAPDTAIIKNELDSDPDQASNFDETVEEDEDVVDDFRFLPDIKTLDVQTQYCDICNIDFVNSENLITHKAKDHGNNPFLKFRYFREMVVENEKAVIKARRKMRQMKEDLKEQMLLDMPGKLCRICRNKFPEEDFQAHWEEHKVHICDQCAYKSIKKSDLDLHIQAVHGNERKFSCHLCGRCFKTKPLVKRHQVVHLNPRKYCCDSCGMRFNDGGTLKTHVHLKHGGTRDFICPICGLAFPMKATLDKHIIRHNKNRPATFYCELCPSTFKDKSSLTRHHLVKHTNEYQRPVCEFCGKSYCSKTKLRMHKERHHSGTAYERKKRGPKTTAAFKEEQYTSESESDESSASYDDMQRRGPRVMNVSEDFYRDDNNSYQPEAESALEGETEYIEYKKEESDERESESSEGESDY